MDEEDCNGREAHRMESRQNTRDNNTTDLAAHETLKEKWGTGICTRAWAISHLECVEVDDFSCLRSERVMGENSKQADIVREICC